MDLESWARAHNLQGMGVPVAAGSASDCPPPTALGLLFVWGRVGLLSFGGGQSAQLYAYESLVEKRGWYTPTGWSRDWTLCQLVPGVNLIAFAVLAGSRLAGLAGSAACLAGLLLPSGSVTVLLVAAYLGLQNRPVVRAAVHGMLFAAAGGGLVNAVRLSRPLLCASRAGGTGILALAVAIMAICGLVALTGRVPIVALMVLAGLVMAVAAARTRARPGAAEPDEVGP